MHRPPRVLTLVYPFTPHDTNVWVQRAVEWCVEGSYPMTPAWAWDEPGFDPSDRISYTNRGRVDEFFARLLCLWKVIRRVFPVCERECVYFTIWKMYTSLPLVSHWRATVHEPRWFRRRTIAHAICSGNVEAFVRLTGSASEVLGRRWRYLRWMGKTVDERRRRRDMVLRALTYPGYYLLFHRILVTRVTGTLLTDVLLHGEHVRATVESFLGYKLVN